MIDKMNNVKYTDNDLNLMSYQELRRLSILLRLPANIKKTYMISMIQAHQKGDGFTKTAIANKIMEERKVKRLTTKGRQAKPYIMVSTTTTQQIPTDLSVSTKHEFETRFSLVAHYTSKDNTSSGISRIIKEETEVSRRNRNILQQSRKPSRKLSTMGRTEIMLPRNHSLTTPVRLMPQYERGFAPLTQYEPVSELNEKAHFQDGGSYNYHFHGEYSNTVMSSSSHEMYRNESYWHPREIYNSSLMPILSSLLTPNTVPINSTGFTSQYPSQSVGKPQSTFQGIYEKYIKGGSLLDGQTSFDQSNPSNSALLANNYYPEENGSNNSGVIPGNYVVTKNDVDFEVNASTDVDATYHQYTRRDDAAVIRHPNGTHYTERNGEKIGNANCVGGGGSGDGGGGGGNDFSSYIGEFFTSESDLSSSENVFRKTAATPLHSNIKLSNMGITHYRLSNSLPPPQNDYEKVCATEERIWNATDSSGKSEMWKSSLEKNNYVTVPVIEGRSSFLSEISESANDCSAEVIHGDSWDKREVNDNPSTIDRHQDLSRCRYVLGHNKYPEAVNRKSSASTVLPSFWSTFSGCGTNNKVYSLCRNSFTGTTETHVNPIMTSTYAKQYTHENSQLASNNSDGSPQITRPWLYSYAEPSQSSFTMENTTYSTWNEYPNEMGDKVIAHDNAHEVQVVKCRKHGCHYLYSVSNSCNQGELQKDRVFDQTAQIKPFI